MVKEHKLEKNRELSVFLCHVLYKTLYVLDRRGRGVGEKGREGRSFSFLCKTPSQTLKEAKPWVPESHWSCRNSSSILL